jgi:hypothetical protein
MPRPFGGRHRESGTQRASLPPPRLPPFLLTTIRGQPALIAPWPPRRGGELSAWQTVAIDAARAGRPALA